MMKNWTSDLQPVRLSWLGILLLALSLSACHAPHSADPIESWNRRVYRFNRIADGLVLKPMTQIYVKTVPRPIQGMVYEFFDNVRLISVIFNDLLQRKPDDALRHSLRLLINSTLGFGGTLDVAAPLGLRRPGVQDFGVTLAAWGYHNSIYVVLPLLGPATVRDFLGYGVFSISKPWIFFGELNRWQLFGIETLSLVDLRRQWLESEDLVNDITFDEYALVRDAYQQNRQKQLGLESESTEDSWV